MSKFCPLVTYEDLVRWRGMIGIVDQEWSWYDPDGSHAGWRLVLFEGGVRKWGNPNEIERLSAEFLGMPNDHNAPEPGDPIESWQQIPHGFDSYLWPDGWDRCMFCGLPENSEIHIDKKA